MRIKPYKKKHKIIRLLIEIEHEFYLFTIVLGKKIGEILGTIVRMRRDSVKAIKPNGEYGRYLQWNYSRTGEGDAAGSSWRAEGDCKEYTVNWEGDSYGWVPVREIEYLLANDRKANKHGGKWTYEPAREAQSVLNEFCSQMDRLVDEAKQKDL